MSTIGPLTGLRIVEVSAFVAAPFAGMTLAQLRAEVIRIDPLSGNVDFNRWPLAPSGQSIYWASLNKSKQSVTLNLKSEEGQALASALIRDAGVLVTNLPARGWLDYERLRRGREDLIVVELTGNYDGSPAVDYTVNPSSGFPTATGTTEEPVNHVLPAWDITAGLYLSLAILAAERSRTATGQGQKVSLALSDVMLATVANLGYVADAQINDHSRGPDGNYVYGAYGRDFHTADGRQIMIAAMTPRQWNAIKNATGLSDDLDKLGQLLGVDLNTDSGRYAARGAISDLLAPWFAVRNLADAEAALTEAGALYGVYRDFRQLVAEDPRCSEANPLFATIEQDGIGRVLAPRSPLSFSTGTQRPAPAPSLGHDTDHVLSRLLHLSNDDIAQLAQAGVINPSTSTAQASAMSS
jgi:2-methylfumaryl-CoA isomerase